MAFGASKEVATFYCILVRRRTVWTRKWCKRRCRPGSNPLT